MSNTLQGSLLLDETGQPLEVVDKTARNSISENAGITIEETTSMVALESNATGYYNKSGTFVADTTRKHAILPVTGGEWYKLTTALSSLVIPGIIYRDSAGALLSIDLVGTGTLELIEDYDLIIPEACTELIVQCATASRTMELKRVTRRNREGCRYIEQAEISLGPDLLANVNGHYVTDTNWTGDKASGYTHSAGRADSISFSCPALEEGEIYICDFDTDYAENEFVNVGIGSQYRIPVYNGTNHIAIPLLAVGVKVLYFTPLSDRTFTISNVTLRKLGGTDAKMNMNLYNVLSRNHEMTYGFWNVFLGRNTAENAVGTTRTLAIGYAALNALQGGHRNVALGTFTMSQMTGGENNVAIGADAMLAITKAMDCIAIGKGAMYNGTLVEDNVVIGHYALTGSTSSSNSKRNVAIGKSAGSYSYGQDNVFVGYQAGYRCQNTNGNVCIGKNAYGSDSGDHNTCVGEQASFASGVSNSSAIGYNAQATKSNQMIIGNENVTEVIIAGKVITFNADGTVTWS